MRMSYIVVLCLASLSLRFADGTKKRYKHEIQIKVDAHICLGTGTKVRNAADILEAYVIMMDGVSERQVMNSEGPINGAVCMTWRMHATQAGPLKGVAIGLQRYVNKNDAGTWILNSMTTKIVGYLYDGTTHCYLGNTVLQYTHNVRVACLSNYDHGAAVAQLHTTYPHARIFTGCTDGWNRQKKC